MFDVKLMILHSNVSTQLADMFLIFFLLDHNWNCLQSNWFLSNQWKIYRNEIETLFGWNKQQMLKLNLSWSVGVIFEKFWIFEDFYLRNFGKFQGFVGILKNPKKFWKIVFFWKFWKFPEFFEILDFVPRLTWYTLNIRIVSFLPSSHK